MIDGFISCPICQAQLKFDKITQKCIHTDLKYEIDRGFVRESFFILTDKFECYFARYYNIMLDDFKSYLNISERRRHIKNINLISDNEYIYNFKTIMSITDPEKALYIYNAIIKNQFLEYLLLL